MLAFAEIVLGPISSVPFDLVRRSLVLRLPIFLFCERHRQRLRQRPAEWLSPLALGTHVCSPKKGRQASPEIHMFQSRSC